MASWEISLSNIHVIENGIQSKLQTFGTFVRDLEASNGDIETQADRGDDIKQTISNMMRNYTTSLDDLQRYCNGNPDRSCRSIIERQKSVMRDFKRDFKRMDDNLQMKVDRLRLLNPGSIHKMNNDESNMHLLLKERNAANNSVMMADEYLNQASESHSQLVNQRQRMEGGHQKMLGMFNRFPVVNNLLNKVSDKKNRDNLIVAIVISSCIFFCIWYAFHSFLS